jgi:protein-tyrosine phosphatase
VNCAGTETENSWECLGVQYLTLNWKDHEQQVLFDEAESIPDQIYNFMEDAINRQESVIVSSVKGQNRACFVIATYIMRRYKWGFLKTLEFVNSRRPDLQMRQSFLF